MTDTSRSCEGCHVTGPDTVDCSNYWYTSIPIECFPESVSSLDLSGNSIYSIDVGEMERYKDLVDLNLGNNMLLRLNRNVFHGQAQIQRIVLKTNRITVISSQVCCL